MVYVWLLCVEDTPLMIFRILSRSFWRLDPLKSEPVSVQFSPIPVGLGKILAAGFRPELIRKYLISSWPFPAQSLQKTVRKLLEPTFEIPVGTGGKEIIEKRT
ncbi:unnamed protein product [Adineta ricciae]|uniref:Uncharacterized protein n=1 Tax=Adineta ricciae TaxID=249248 RepID=A0A815A3J2_ADIRI|nr:unnamed protein product [Adineta ricciae]CAF1251546.1 unnamed protein product [Adineta ricciae]